MHILYTPDADFCGTDSFTYTVIDSSGEHSDTATVTVNVVCPEAIIDGKVETMEFDPDVPILSDDEAQTEVDTAILIPVLENDANVPPSESLQSVVSEDAFHIIMIRFINCFNAFFPPVKQTPRDPSLNLHTEPQALLE